jgi:hypothetical protein
MNGAIAAQIAVEAMRNQFDYRDQGDQDTTAKWTAREHGVARLLRTLSARLSRRSQRPARAARMAR